MLLTPLVFIAAITLEALGSYMSVIGLSSKSSLILIVLAIALDFSKIVITSVLYKNWKDLNFLFKLFLVPTTAFLMLITSYGAYAYLLQEFAKTTANGDKMITQLALLEEEALKINTRKKEIDSQIASVDPTFVTQKRRLYNMFAKELEYINTRVIELDQEIPKLKSMQMNDNLEAGTLGSLAKSWGTTTSETAKIIAFLMVIVIDPLAIVMLIVGNFLFLKRENSKKEELLNKSKTEEVKKEDNFYTENFILKENNEIISFKNKNHSFSYKNININSSVEYILNNVKNKHNNLINEDNNFIKEDISSNTELKIINEESHIFESKPKEENTILENYINNEYIEKINNYFEDNYLTNNNNLIKELNENILNKDKIDDLINKNNLNSISDLENTEFIQEVNLPNEELNFCEEKSKNLFVYIKDKIHLNTDLIDYHLDFNKSTLENENIVNVDSKDIQSNNCSEELTEKNLIEVNKETIDKINEVKEEILENDKIIQDTNKDIQINPFSEDITPEEDLLWLKKYGITKTDSIALERPGDYLLPHENFKFKL